MDVVKVESESVALRRWYNNSGRRKGRVTEKGTGDGDGDGD